MASPFKTHETMDLARALLEDVDSSSCIVSRGSRREREESREDSHSSTFRALVVTKDSSTELIPTLYAESSGATNANKSASVSEVIRDLNAGKDMLDDDGKPAVGKVFSRVIQISNDNKPKQLKLRRGAPKREERCSGSGCTSNREKSGSDRPQSSAETQSHQQRTSGPATISNVCPACRRQFSDETMKHHMVFCSGCSKEIM